MSLSASAPKPVKARILAAQRLTSISGLLTEEIEKLVGAEAAYERSMRSALASLEKRFHLA